MKKGKKCPSCGQVNVQGTFQCRKCGTDIEKVELKLHDTDEFEIEMAPEGMISVAEFGKRKGVASKKVVDMIRDGFYVGRKVGDEWFIDKSELQGKNTKQKNSHVFSVSQSDNNYTRVVVTDIQMPFESMVVFLVKLAIAAIPAFIILSVLFFIVFAIFGGLITAF